MDKVQKNLKNGAYILAIGYILVGIAAIAIPDDLLKVFGYIVGGACIVAGAVFVINYLIRDVKTNFFRNDFLHGLVAIVVGIVIILKVELVVSLIPLALGIMVIISGCTKLQNVIDLKRMNSDRWIPMLVVAVLNLILGAVLVANPFESATLFLRILGIGLVFSGLTDLFSTLFFSKEWKASVTTAEEVSSGPVVRAEEVKKEEESGK